MARRSASLICIPLFIAAVFLLFAVQSGGRPVSAADFTVDSTADVVDANPGDGVCDDGAGNCTLRAAIQEANALSGPDAITLPAETYMLTIVGTGEDAAADGDLDITDDLTITGVGEASTIIDANGGVTSERAMDVDPVGAGISVEVTGVTVRNGSSTTSGGGILNKGTLTLTDVTISGNTATHNGGGILNSGTLTLTNSTLEGNMSNLTGGGICDDGKATLINVTISGNTAAFHGGGIYNIDLMAITDSAVTGNTAAGTTAWGAGSGGGIYNVGLLTVTDSTISGNGANGVGGGIANSMAGLEINSSAVSDNAARDGGGIYNAGLLTATNVTISGNAASSAGGGIANAWWGDDPPTLTNVTINGNTAENRGGGIFSRLPSPPAKIPSPSAKNTIIANSGSSSDCGGNALISLGHNLDSDGTCGLAGTGDLSNTDPLLGPLADNGGPTLTHALLSGSPAVDAGDNAVCPTTDQRGVARPVDGDQNGTAVCDIGAYEAPEGTTVPTPTPTPTPAPTPTPTSAVLPVTGGEPGPGGGGGTLAIALLAAGALGLAGAGGAVVAARRTR